MRLLFLITALALSLPMSSAWAALDERLMSKAEVKALQKKVKTKDSDAQYRLGIAYLYGQGGLEQNYDVGMRFIERSSNQGKKEAQFYLGAKMHVMNMVTKFENPDLARNEIQVLAKSYGQGCAGAAGLIAGVYVYTKGQNSKEAAQWYIRAAQGGDVASQALMATRATKVGKLDEAYAWTYLTSKEHPHIAAVKAQLAKLGSDLGPEKLKDAVVLGKQFVKEYSRNGNYPFCTIGALKAISPLKY